MQMKRAIAYYRVSTQRQGRSGLGLDAQMAAVNAFVSRNGFVLAGEHCEVESGMKCDRPILEAALQDCLNTKAILLIAKLDRLGRDTVFVSSLMRSKVEIKAVDNPDAGKLLLHIMAAIAEEERDQISNRTKAALEIAKKRGVELGKHGKYVLSKLNKLDADRFARNMQPIIDRLRQKGIRSIRAIAEELNRLNIPTALNNRWHPSSVHTLIKRIQAIE